MTDPAELPESRSSDDLPPFSNSTLMYGVTSFLPPKVARRPGDTHLRAFSHPRGISLPHRISDPEASFRGSFRGQPVYATTSSTMDKSKDYTRGGAVLDVSAATVSHQPLSLVVKPPAAAGDETNCHDPNRAGSAAIWLCRSATIAEDGAPDDVDGADASMISWTHFAQGQRELVEDLAHRQALVGIVDRLAVGGAAFATRAAVVSAHAEIPPGVREVELAL